MLKKWLKDHQLLVGILMGVVTTFVAPYFVNYVSFLTIDAKRAKIESKIQVAEKFIADLERIRIIAPNNSELQDCLSEQNTQAFRERYEICVNRIKQNEQEARTLLNRNISALAVFFGDDFVSKIASHIATIDYGLYEMGNNQMLIASWKSGGCPDSVDIVNNDEAGRAKIILNDEGKIDCALSLQSAEQFIKDTNDNSSCGDNFECVSATKEKKVDIDAVHSLIIPGSSTSLNKYFAHANSVLLTEVNMYINELLELVRQEIDL